MTIPTEHTAGHPTGHPSEHGIEVSALEIPTVIASAETQFAIEQFLYYEARLLDEWRWNDWFDLLTDDVRYWMPVRKNRLRVRGFAGEIPKGIQISHFDDTKETMRGRILQLESSTHWSEDPPSRTRHVVSNVWVSGITTPEDDSAEEYQVRSYFVLYRNRGESEVDIWAGQRDDTLRRHPTSGFQIASRRILLDQNVLLAKNLSVPF